MPILDTTGVDIPETFPFVLYKEITDILRKESEMSKEAWKEWAIAWNALSY